jgi:hypothetical protein
MSRRSVRASGESLRFSGSAMPGADIAATIDDPVSNAHPRQSQSTHRYAALPVICFRHLSHRVRDRERWTRFDLQCGHWRMSLV